jgi:hypothetical protein
MKIVDKNISKNELKKMSQTFAGGLVKAVIDVKKEIMVVDAPMHADEEKELLDMGSNQDDLWGINLYPDMSPDEFIEFDSMINVRPRLNNFTRGIEDDSLQKKIIKVVSKLINE